MLKLKDIHKGYAIVPKKQYLRYGENSYVENVEMSLELARKSKFSFERCDGIDYVIINRNHGLLTKDSRAGMIETTIMAIANNIYRKKDAFGLPMSQKDLDEVINMIVQSPVFKRLVEQVVRDWIKQANPYDINIK